MTSKEVAQIVDSEGLGYSIEEYLSETEIEDPILKEKWIKAQKLMEEIREMLPEPYDDDMDY